jgi:hypothetical protein
VPVALPSIRKKNLSPREVHRIIKQGYDTLSIQQEEGVEVRRHGLESVDGCRSHLVALGDCIGCLGSEPVPVALPSIRKKNLSPREVHRIIKQGYDTLSIHNLEKERTTNPTPKQPVA